MDIVLNQDHAAPADHIGKGGLSAFRDHDGSGVAAGGGEENAADGLEPVLGLQLPGNHPLGVSADGDKLEVVDIPTGYVHNIENVGAGEMVTVMWANEAFDPEHPDTYAMQV